MQVASDKKSVTELTGQAVKAAGNAQTYMEQAGQIKTDIDVQSTEIITQATAQADRAQGAADGIRDTADTLQADNEHLKAELKHANRRISVLYDLGKGITHRYETDNDTAYSKEIPSGAKVMDVKLIGGKSVVGNQMIKHDADYILTNSHGVSIEQNGDNFTVTFSDTNARFMLAVVHPEAGHKYYQSITLTMLAGERCGWQNFRGIAILEKTTVLNTPINLDAIAVANNTDDSAYIQLMGYSADDGTLSKLVTNYKTARLVDLTQMFGAGNEPTLEQCREIFASESYPYNAGTLTSADVTAVQVGDKVISLPNSISLKSAGSVYDSLEFYEQDGKYYQKHTQRVGMVDLGTLNWRKLSGYKDIYFASVTNQAHNTTNYNCSHYTSSSRSYSYLNDMEITGTGGEGKACWIKNTAIGSLDDLKASLQGVLLYYELATPIVTVTEVDNRFDAIDCKAGDKITFVGNSDYHLPVPNEEEYLIALNEVTA